ncbi:MAG: Ni/Fe hydrogenase subunit alpha [Sulfolobales archaeon]|nr:Ni/Fe hydrogenase subunit alpha [Sulfolobales archaeon]MCX8186778.1 Ni/Fe hydrogenase subunit alpha [Sulfolobales archaeon]MDW7969889.1 Ni/Fe hydrogenase subunit alpha [Sulfolobales archaeon]
MSRAIKVDYLSRVEGEGNLYVEIENNQISKVELGIFEAPRFFEAFLRGRKYVEVPDITARICGICPVAYIMSSSRAIEKILGIEVDECTDILRRIIYLGEWIESHLLHVLMLHAPDFLGHESIIGIAKENPDIVKKGLKLKSWGNSVMKVIGGRSVHPISCRVGGFYRIIRKEELETLIKHSDVMGRYAEDLLKWVLTLKIPELKRDVEYVSLKGVNEYPILRGRVVSNRGLDIAEDVFEEYVETEQVRYSTSLRYRIRGRSYYVVGPLARYNNNYHLLRPEVREVIESYGYGPQLSNSFQSIIARAAETYHAVLEIKELIKKYSEPAKPYEEGGVMEGVGSAITEAPRGILYHRYELDGKGYVINSNIIPPTSQNLASIERDIIAFNDELVKMDLSDLQRLAEHVVRNYDPCISCATHFIKVINIKINT